MRTQRFGPRIAGLVTALAVATAACDRPPPVPTAEESGVRTLDPVLAACTPEQSVTVAVDTVATGLEVPWDVTFLDDGRALLTERPGRIRVMGPDGVLQPAAWAELPVGGDGEVGLMGIDHRVGDDGRVEVYVAATFDQTGGPAPVRLLKGVLRRVARTFDRFAGQPRTLEIVRLPVEPTGEAGPPETVVTIVPVGSLHGGGALRFGPDGLLYVTNGDGGEPWHAADPESPSGKLLRFTPEGEPAPLDPSDPVPAILGGIRNAQGIAWHPVTGDLVVIGHGPSGLPRDDGRVGNDELDFARPGDDLGWPIVAGASEGGGFRSPVVEWTPSIAPAGVEVTGDPSEPWGRAVFVASLGGGLRRLPLTPDAGSSPLCDQPILRGEVGRIRMVSRAPDGSLWIATSNRDGRGGVRPGDDLLLRLRPPSATPSAVP